MGYHPKETTPWNKGIKIDREKFPRMGHFKKHTQESKQKNRVAHLGRVSWSKGLTKESDPRIVSGERHYKWKGGITSKDIYMRKLFKKNLQKTVLERDDYTCQFCGARGDLQVDHIQPWSDYVELRFNIDNCRTLCKACHYKITYGKDIPSKYMPWGHTKTKERRVGI